MKKALAERQHMAKIDMTQWPIQLHTMPEFILPNTTQNAFRKLIIHTMHWPAYSPNVWSLLKLRINKRGPRPITKQHMSYTIHEE